MVLKWFRKREKSEPLTPEQRRELEERERQELLDELHRHTDSLLVQYRELARQHRPEKVGDIPEGPLRFTSVEEGREYMERLGEWIRS